MTVTVTVVEQPTPAAYIIELVPAETLVTMPVAPTVATTVLLLVHVPPEPSLRAVVPPRQTWVTPLMTGGPVLTVSVVVAKQPDGNV